MNMRLIPLTILTVFTSSCRTTIKKEEQAPITFEKAMEQLSAGMKKLKADNPKGSSGTFGLAATQLEATFEIGTTKENGLTIGAEVDPTNVAKELTKIGGEYNATVNVSRGNKVVITFKNVYVDKDGKPYPTMADLKAYKDAGFTPTGAPIEQKKTDGANNAGSGGSEKPPVTVNNTFPLPTTPPPGMVLLNGKLVSVDPALFEKAVLQAAQETLQKQEEKK